MQEIQRLLQLTQKHHANSLMLYPGATPRVKTPRGWHEISQDKFSPTQLRELIWDLLTENQRLQLQEKGVVWGSVSLPDKVNINFQIFQHRIGYAGVFGLIHSGPANWLESQLSPQLIDHVLKGRGLTIIAGPRNSGKSALSSVLIEKINKSTNAHVAYFCNVTEYLLAPQAGVVSQFELGGRELCDQDFTMLPDADYIVFDCHLNAAVQKHILRAVQAGASVVLIDPSDALETFVHRWLSASAQMSEAREMQGLVNILGLYVSQRLLSGPQAPEAVVAQEILYFNDQMKAKLSQQDWPGLYKYVSDQGEKAGMKTLNHSLVQLLIRRKIEVRDAFKVSSDPEQLDIMLKKMGI